MSCINHIHVLTLANIRIQFASTKNFITISATKLLIHISCFFLFSVSFFIFEVLNLLCYFYFFFGFKISFLINIVYNKGFESLISIVLLNRLCFKIVDGWKIFFFFFLFNIERVFLSLNFFFTVIFSS